METRVLFASPEAHPLIKTGGLGDVSGALPAALRRAGVDARLLLPAYPGVLERIDAQPVGEPRVFLPAVEPARLFQGRMPEDTTPVYALSCPALYERDGSPYVDPEGEDWPDNLHRFALLSRVAAELGGAAGLAGWRADIVHSNDWQTGLAPAYLSYQPEVHARSVFSVHNLAFQGTFARAALAELDLPPESFSIHGLELYGQVSFLKAGLYYADHLTTVSPTYAREIQTPELGYRLEGLIASRREVLTGILNGIDVALWDPEHDPHLPAHYSARNILGKSADKRALRERLGLAQDSEVPVVGMVSRLTWQKGIDLVLEVADRLLEEPVQLAMLGSGDQKLEARLRRLAADHPGRVGLQVGYDEPLAHLIEAGSDLFLMPSRFEPCGLNQMYSMRYGTPPVVRATGGLADSVVDATPATLAAHEATGFVFQGANAEELYAGLLRALVLFGNKKAWWRLQLAGMQRDFSWDRSAREYLEVYRRVLA